MHFKSQVSKQITLDYLPLSFFVFISFVYWGAHAHRTHVEVRGQLSEVGSFLPLFGAWELKSGHQAQWQLSLPIEPSFQPLLYFFFKKCVCVCSCVSLTRRDQLLALTTLDQGSNSSLPSEPSPLSS